MGFCGIEIDHIYNSKKNCDLTANLAVCVLYVVWINI